MTNIIITDLTRFSNPEIVCTAGICPDTLKCIRPLPYLKRAFCEDQHILFGSILSGNFTLSKDAVKPHSEGKNYTIITNEGTCTANDFRDILLRSSVETVSNGFSMKFEPNQKHIPIGCNVSISLITIKINSEKLFIVEDGYSPGKIRLNFIDNDGLSFRFLSITDLGFYLYAEKNIDKLNQINNFLKDQSELFLKDWIVKVA